ncbi:MAG: VWA domain-containing protein [Proteobacteria bacterium]|nr:VWA domain-containing protein [Pseudomonadota bacterium]
MTAILLLAGVAGAQDKTAEEQAGIALESALEQLRGQALTIGNVDPNEITAYVLVVGEDGKGVAGLQESDFAIVERTADGSSTPVFPSFGTADEEQRAISVALTMDYSKSMPEKDIVAMEEANLRFVQRLRPERDHVAVVKFASDTKLVWSGEAHPRKGKRAIARKVKVGGKTALLDAVVMAYDELDINRDIRMVVAFTDGKDTASTSGPDEVVAMAEGLQAPVLAVGLGADVDHAALLELAAATRGFYVYVEDSRDLARLYQTAADLLRGAYVLRWKPNHPTGTNVGAAVFVSLPGVEQPLATGLAYVAGTSMTGPVEMLEQGLGTLPTEGMNLPEGAVLPPGMPAPVDPAAPPPSN